MNKTKKTIVFDFDGVIHIGYCGYKDGSIYGQIDYDVLDYMQELMSQYYVVICSNRNATQIANFMNNLEYKNLKFETYGKQEKMYWDKDDVIGVTNDKAVGVLYIDDRGYRYTDLESLKNFVNQFKIK